MSRAMMVSGAALAGLLATAVPVQGQAPDESADWRAIAECARIGNADQRHGCMDDVVRRAGLLDPAQEAAAARDDFGRGDRSQKPQGAVLPHEIPTTPAPAARPGPVQSEATPPAESVPATKRLSTTIRSAQLAGNRRLTVVTADGAVWQQTESEEFHALPRSGDAFTVERGSLGSYRCTFGRSSVYRCRRLD